VHENFIGGHKMKTKLLKKVRKRYQISKITCLDPFLDKDILEKKKMLGWVYPIYKVTDLIGMYASDVYQESLDEAKSSLIKMIKRDYSNHHKRITHKSTKVWYNAK
jgi:hypothetical protein